MSDTIAMPQDLLERCNLGGGANPLCPACPSGRLHPYYVSFSTSIMPGTGWYGADYLNGFVAVCMGIRDSPHFADAPPCGFSMPLVPGSTGRMGR
jgi:hypothetical protein